MMRGDVNWRNAVEQSAHYKAIGQTEIYLSGGDPLDRPWDYATKVEEGGSHRLDIATSVAISGAHPCGLTFRWYFDVEPSSANGKGHYEINVAGCRRVLALLPPGPANQFRVYLANCIEALSKSAAKYQAIADAERNTIAQLREVVPSMRMAPASQETT